MDSIRLERRRSFTRKFINFRGFTLLEVLLSLALMVVVVAAIGSAINMHLWRLTKQQKAIETKQISRSIIAMIQNDIRAAIQFKPEDYTGLENLSVSLELIAGIAENLDGEGELPDGDLAGGGALDDGAGGQIPGGQLPGGEAPGGDGNTGEAGDAVDGAGATPEPGANDSASGEEGEVSEEGEEEEVEIPARPALIGERSLIRVDVSRMPRLDEYNQIIARLNNIENSPSDIKTISYFFSREASRLEHDVQNNVGTEGGLYRRQVDRAVAAFAGDEGDSNVPDDNSRLVAPEVIEIQFRYWDGEEWQEEWNSEEMMGFPAAIEVQILIDPTSNDPFAAEDRVVNREDLETHRTVIDLPIAEIIEEVEDGTEESQ